jgi:hypothetical protein
MVQDSSGPDLPQKLHILAIVRAALLVSIVIYYSVSYFLPSGQGMDASTLRMLTLAFSVMAFSLVVVGTVLRRTLLSEEKLIRLAGYNLTAGPMPESAGIVRAVNYWVTWNILTWALFESVAVFGLVLHMLGASREQFSVFAAVAFLAILLVPPRPNRIRSTLHS